MKSVEARNILGVTQKTLNTYIKTGKLHPVKINTNHYEYDRDEIYALLKKDKQRVNVTYSRVSHPKQANDLKIQTSRLYDFAIKNGYTLQHQFEDIKNGMEFKNRNQFNQLLDMVINNEINTVIIENKDRLVRFGFDLIETIFTKHGTNIVVVSEAENKTYEQELTDDLISIIHYYSMKSYNNRRKLHNAENALKNNETEPQE